MRRFARLLIVGSALAVASFSPSTVRAHTDIDYTVPTDGAAVGDVLTEITVAFNEPVMLLGPGFEVLDPQGRVVVPFAVTDDDIVFRLQLDPPIGGGLVAVKYTVAAQDGHTIEGNFTFTVAADEPEVTEPSTTSEPPTTSSPTAATTEPAATAEVEATAPPDDAAPTTPSTAPPEPTASPATVGDEPATDDAAAVDTDDPANDADDADDGDDGSPTTLILIGLGGVVAAAFAFVLIRSRATG